MPDQSLLLLLDEVRGKTLRVLHAVDPRHARWSPPGLHNTILWHAGHAYVLAEWLTMRALGRKPQIPEGWFGMFSWKSHPADVPADRWPPLSEVIRHLEAQRERLGRVIGALTDEQLGRPSAADPRHTVRRSILHGLHDEAGHCGEMYLLLKMRRASAGQRP
jgi:hypothetical protein